ncbi:hypothetical protein EDEG_00216 [Edhazardia aedis USNM 41457]|uniref:Uncharacterized protein n=1 Tax=Edhazardia aedis (strain USNM 41457) TaxID=1003232 RepID=J9DPM3_EDHAE|nr:hypothetical protein EDEG_00216 [Edhazardia aedis USNM 41457]|eukprot:EJW03307.1 hypothetical protein EDEG_00216 [Edhazardia aedis USNM 41457]
MSVSDDKEEMYGENVQFIESNTAGNTKKNKRVSFSDKIELNEYQPYDEVELENELAALNFGSDEYSMYNYDDKLYDDTRYESFSGGEQFLIQECSLSLNALYFKDYNQKKIIEWFTPRIVKGLSIKVKETSETKYQRKREKDSFYFANDNIHAFIEPTESKEETCDFKFDCINIPTIDLSVKNNLKKIKLVECQNPEDSISIESFKSKDIIEQILHQVDKKMQNK